MKIQREHMLSLFAKGVREDERGFENYREIKIEKGISPKSAEGSARVKIGKTEVLAGVKLEVGEPFPDMPDEGTIMVNVELLPLSSPEFELGPPGIEAIELARVVDRGIRESGVLDFKKLCIEKGEKIWLVLIDIYPVNNDGNLFDACALAALSALQDTKFPYYDGKKVDYNRRTDKKLPLGKDLSISCTVIKIGSYFLVDPVPNEEALIDARLTVAVLDDGRICAMQKGGVASLKIEDLRLMVDLAMRKAKELRKLVS